MDLERTPARLPLDVDRAALQGHPSLAVHAIFALDHEVGRDPRCGDIAGLDRGGDEAVVRPAFVQYRRSGIERGNRIHHCRQLLIGDRGRLG